jgi:hypothetical protein
VFYWRKRRNDFNVLLHAVAPALGVLAFVGPLYYQYNPLPPYPVRYANWIAIGWLAAGVLVTFWMARYRREALVDAQRIFVEDETVAPSRPAPVPTPGSAPAGGP